MAVKARLRSAAASDPGRRRKNNEDRFLVDSERGIYAVIDGVGGHAAGERAAQVALDVIRERLARPSGSPEERLREAIALANNEIWRLSRTRAEWHGMACVLTIALIEEDIVTVGHVGDTRLYLLRAGVIHKVTHDHSPVGEREDRGELSEEEAMRHARRNEIYRDVGSGDHNPDDLAFIEVTSFPMPSDGALLLCSDGLTDLRDQRHNPRRRRALCRRPDYEPAMEALIDVANHSGGKDNITVVMVAGPEYAAALPAADASVRARPRRRAPIWIWLGFALLAGIALGAGGFAAWQRYAVAGPRVLNVGAAGIADALGRAQPGDTVVIPQGRYRERIELREGVTVRSQQAGAVTLISPDGGPAVVAKKIDSGTLEGVWIQGDLAAPVSDGIEIVDASPAISNVKITGERPRTKIRWGIGGAHPISPGVSQIVNNLGAGL